MKKEILNWEIFINMKLTKLLENTINKKLDLVESTVSDYPKSLILALKKDKKLSLFESFLSSLPGGMAPAVVQKGITDICKTKGNAALLSEIFKSKNKLSSLTQITPTTGIYGLLYNIQPKGTGPGEVLISWLVKGATVQGGNMSYDIEYNGQKWEVKSLIDPESNATRSIDPATYGKISNFTLTKKYQNFWETIIEPYYTNELRSGVLSLSEDPTVQEKIIKVLDTLETIPRTNTSGVSFASAVEMTEKIFDSFYNAITDINTLIPKTVKDKISSSRIIVKAPNVDSQYWIEKDDVDDITKNAGKDTEISIKVGEPITDENKSAQIWFSRLLNNEFIQNPKIFVNELRAIRDNFFSKKDGIIYFMQNKINIAADMNDFFTSNITRGTYRFAVKSLKKYQNYEYQKQQ